MSGEPGEQVSARWAQWRRDVPLADYHSRWQRLEAQGKNSHGEADFIEGYSPATVLDAGCGMGRVAIELARRGVDVDGTDLDDDLLDYARRDAPHITWVSGSLANVQLPRRYDLIAMPGNVMIFCDVADRAPIVRHLAGYLMPGGLLVAGFSIDDVERVPDALGVDEYDTLCAAAGLQLFERFATWERDAWSAEVDGRPAPYAVSVHRLT